MTALSLVFAGSPNAAVPSLTALNKSRHKVVSVITRTDSEQGRRRVLTPTTVADAAHAMGIPSIKTNRLDETTSAEVAALSPDLGVIVAYGGLVREPLLSIPRLGWINLHFSLLPRWRGAAPVQHAVIAGDELTGATVFRLVKELDAGEVYGQFTQKVTPRDTTGSLLESLSEGGAQLLLRVVDALADGTARADAQLGDVTLAPKLSAEDARIDWNTDVHSVDRRIRGVTPEPGAFTILDGARLKIVEAVPALTRAWLAPGTLAEADGCVLMGTATSPLELVRVHAAGKRPMSAAEWWRGRGSSAKVVAE